MSRRLFKFRSSLFLKLFLVMGVSGVLISLVVREGYFFALHAGFDPRVHQNIEQYARYLIQDLGEPPHFEKGKPLADRLGLNIRIEGNGWVWSSSPDLPPIASMPDHGPGRGPGHPPGPGRHPHSLFAPQPPKHGPFVIIDHVFPSGPAKMLLLGPKRPVLEPRFGILMSLVAVVALILLGTYFTIRWILSPIRSLSYGVTALAGGSLEHQVPVESTDELGNLAGAFNSMIRHVKEMVYSKQRLLIDVSHELRSPLTRAKVGLELLDPNDGVRQITADLGELEEMIQGLLEAARLDSGQKVLSLEPVDAVALTREIVAQYTGLGKPVRLDVSAESLTANLDTQRYKSVVRNLVDNALKYSNEKQEVQISLEARDGKLVLQVKDLGVGIPPADLQRVFEPFYRVDKSRTRKTGGFGLGLSLCKKIVEAHGGVIALVSLPGKGTTVTVTLPLK